MILSDDTARRLAAALGSPKGSGKREYPNAKPGSRAAGRGGRAGRDKGHVQVWHAPHETDGPGFTRRRDALKRCRPGEQPVLYQSES